ncbi:hypothetical protein HYH03_000982 [Edaphochlamys debaryana]|uniref:STAS domain-containing protein n=1 Tax=Edaphochlamys debaryana TaxID=47281 RepID=A0A835YDZ9_9CHLO|nr:hypothetical protein HYH03_000982 [Edaphochlamys debaryana]|eukprot:KAG2501167.1 hypothetical protein HYH03_000982 [Edaphochlamys debaryana]
MAGSAALALSVPVALGSVNGGRVQAVSPSEASILLSTGTNVKLVDVRSRLEVKIEGLPLKRTDRRNRVIHAPFNELRGGKLRPVPNFLDDVVFASGVDSDTTLVIMSSRGSETQRKAVDAILQMGGRHDIYTVQGGFRAWQAAGLDTEQASLVSDASVDSTDEDDYDYYGGSTTSSGEGASASRAKLKPGSTGVEEMFLESSSTGGGLLSTFSMALSRIPFKPKLLEVIKQGYTKDDLRRDVMAGLVVGVIALALGMALGIASDSTPAVGIYTVVVGGLIASALSGSRVTVVGPTAAFIPIVAGVAHDHGPAGLAACTALAGSMLVVMGVTGMGGIIRYVPKPVVTGFTAGIATYIFSTQLKDFLGLGAPGRLPEGVPVPTEFLEKVVYLGSHLDGTHIPSLAMAAGCLALMKLWPKDWAKVLPQPIVAVIAGTLALQAMQIADPGTSIGIETIGSHFGAGAIPQSLPSFQWPEALNAEEIPALIYPAATIAMLAAIESLLCARVSDGMIGDRHDSNTELISQGVANISCSVLGCLPATGALARTAANVRAGGRSPVSGIVHAAVVAAVVLAGAGPLAENVPLPALSAVLVVVALNMGEWHNFTQLSKWPKNDSQLFLIAFSLTVLQDVAVAVAFGMVIALAIFVQDTSSSMYVRALPSRSVIVPQDFDLAGDPHGATASSQQQDDDPYRRRTPMRSAAGSDEEEQVEGPSPTRLPGTALPTSLALGIVPPVVPAGVVYVEVTGSLLFGAGEMLEKAVEASHSADPVQVLVLNLSRVSVVDVSGLEVLEGALAQLEGAGKGLVMCGLTRQPLRMMARAGFLDEVGRENVCRSVEVALDRAAAIVAAKREASHNHVSKSRRHRSHRAKASAATAAAAAAVVANGAGNGGGSGAASDGGSPTDVLSDDPEQGGVVDGYVLASALKHAKHAQEEMADLLPMGSADMDMDIWTNAAVPRGVHAHAAGGRLKDNGFPGSGLATPSPLASADPAAPAAEKK